MTSRDVSENMPNFTENSRKEFQKFTENSRAPETLFRGAITDFTEISVFKEEGQFHRKCHGRETVN